MTGSGGGARLVRNPRTLRIHSHSMSSSKVIPMREGALRGRINPNSDPDGGVHTAGKRTRVRKSHMQSGEAPKPKVA